MEKEFVEYIEALALKDLGFDEPCLAFYNGKFLQSTDYDFDEGISRDIGLCCKTPTFSQAFRWFRKTHNLRFCIIDDHSDGEKPYSFTSNHEYYYDTGTGNPWFVTPEEAEIACLVKLIEIVKEKLNAKD